jgi:signal transduction histidine kinase
MEFDEAGQAARVIQEICSAFNIAHANISPEFQFIHASENLSGFTALSRPDISGCPLFEAFPELAGHQENLRTLLSGETPVLHLDRIDCHRVDGSSRPLDFAFFPVDSGNPGQGLSLLVQDASQSGTRLVEALDELAQVKEQLLRAEAALQRLHQIKSVILSTAAHDMRSPLNAILGYSEWIYDDLPQDSESENRELLSIIISQAQLLDHLISDLLDLDQIEQGKLRLTPRPCNVNQIIQRVSTSVKAMVDFQDQALTLSLPEFPLIIQADPDRLTQILYNLLGNAIKYTPEGGNIQIHAWKENDHGVLCVKDDAATMSPGEQAQFFNLNLRTGGASRSLARGAGLGMYLVKSLVEAHHGKIEVISQPDQGVAITIRLPLAQERF